jgi:hypothetical protein
MNRVTDLITREVVRAEKNIFISRLVIAVISYGGFTILLNAIRQTVPIWLLWILITVQLLLFLTIFVVISLRMRQCRYHIWWLLLPLILSRINNWERVVIPATMILTLILSEMNKHISHERMHLVPSDDDRDDDSALQPEVGRDIAWTDIICQIFRVLEFDRAGTTIGRANTVRAASSTSPYGYLLVESPILNQLIRLPIVHRDDFLLAASVYEEPPLLTDTKEEELLVTYAPEHKLPGGLAGTSHALHYVITPRGTLDRYYEVGNDNHMALPAPEKLFGPFVWHGKIIVKINRQPNL